MPVAAADSTDSTGSEQRTIELTLQPANDKLK